MNIDIGPAGDAEFDIIHNLARFYMYDMAEHAGWPFDETGSFEAEDSLNPYWGRPRPSRVWPGDWLGMAFLARVDGNPAGFALVVRQQEAPAVFDMGEFFVARQYRRHDLGRRLAYAMFDRFAGQWVVREMLSNVGAQAFWRRIIGDYTKGDFRDSQEHFKENGDRDFIVQRFESGKH